MRDRPVRRFVPSQPATPRSLHKPLLDWYDRNQRALPWRGGRDGYAVWVSEIMLQQTRVETVVPYFLRWMEKFPDVQSLALAGEEAVLAAWSGLGYYSRARNLHKAARIVRAQFGGQVPQDVDALRTLPGIGPYTAGAIASIVGRARVPAVDGNVLRVLARLDGDARDITLGATRRAFARRAAELVPAGRPGDWNQALMDLGAEVCMARSPNCVRCPLAAHCVAHANNTTGTLPVRAARKAPREQQVHLALVRAGARVLLVRERGTGLLGGLWVLPHAADVRGLDQVLGAVGVAGQVDIRLKPGAPVATAEHRFTHRIWRMHVHPTSVEPRATDACALGSSAAEVRWFSDTELQDGALSAAARKALAAGLSASSAQMLAPTPAG